MSGGAYTTVSLLGMLQQVGAINGLRMDLNDGADISSDPAHMPCRTCRIDDARERSGFGIITVRALADPSHYPYGSTHNTPEIDMGSANAIDEPPNREAYWKYIVYLESVAYDLTMHMRWFRCGLAKMRKGCSQKRTRGAHLLWYELAANEQCFSCGTCIHTAERRAIDNECRRSSSSAKCIHLVESADSESPGMVKLRDILDEQQVSFMSYARVYCKGSSHGLCHRHRGWPLYGCTQIPELWSRRPSQDNVFQEIPGMTEQIIADASHDEWWSDPYDAYVVEMYGEYSETVHRNLGILHLGFYHSVGVQRRKYWPGPRPYYGKYRNDLLVVRDRPPCMHLHVHFVDRVYLVDRRECH